MRQRRAMLAALVAAPVLLLHADVLTLVLVASAHSCSSARFVARDEKIERKKMKKLEEEEEEEKEDNRIAEEQRANRGVRAGGKAGRLLGACCPVTAVFLIFDVDFVLYIFIFYILKFLLLFHYCFRVGTVDINSTIWLS